MKKRENLVLQIIFTLTSIGIILFIFTNSMLDASASTVQSTGVLDVLHNILESIGIYFRFSENFVRKCAHFIEYSALGLSLFFMYKSYLNKNKLIVAFTLLTGLITASLDETIQLFSDGRSGQLSDVVLDFSAVALWTALLCIIVFVNKNKRGKK